MSPQKTLTVTFSDGQVIDANKIMRVIALEFEGKLLVETATGPIKVQGVGVGADLVMLKDVREKGRLFFLIHEK